uniref:Uncharacterized protein n=1 Tax=Arundo donax TaxID=35708 RepID=A0A0A9C1N8_ARUDO
MRNDLVNKTNIKLSASHNPLVHMRDQRYFELLVGLFPRKQTSE